jgi:hypothetical protein
MGDIYSKAALIYVWLGGRTESSDRAMAYLATVGVQGYYQGSPNVSKQ